MNHTINARVHRLPFCPECFAKRCDPCLEHGRVRAPHRVRQLVADGLVVVKRSRRWRALLGLALVVACGDNAVDVAPDALPLCSSILEVCGDVASQSRVCVATGECYCDPDAKGPAPRVRCALEVP